MKLVTFSIPTPIGEVRRVGAIVDDSIIDLSTARELQLLSRGIYKAEIQAENDCPSNMMDFIKGGSATLAMAKEAIDYVKVNNITEKNKMVVSYTTDQINILPPLPRANSIRCFSLSEKHMLDGIASMQDTAAWGNTKPSLTKMPEEWYNLPTYYKTGTTEVYGTGEVVPWPSITDKFDYELEIGVIIGKEGRNITTNGESYIYGYTIYNDWSTRDFQNREMSVNLGPGLCKDNASSLGPCIVTQDEIEDIQEKTFTVSINGEKKAETHAEFYFSLEHLIYYVSTVQTIFPGDIFTTGTLPGGSGAEKKIWVQPGDVVEFQGDGIGTLRSIIGKKGELVSLPAAQRPWINGKKLRDC